jgi:DNA-binding transcriptional MerR regulator
MPVYQTGEIERLLGIKSHVLRYWEKEFSMLQPRKDVFGHKAYSGRDVRVLLRLKHLLYGRRFTIEGARKQIMRELSGGDQDIRGIVDAARAELVAVFFIARQIRSQAAAALGETPAPEAEGGTEEESK